MANVVPVDFDQWVRLAESSPTQVYIRTQVNPARYTVACLPIDMVVTNVTQAQLDRALAEFSSMERVASINGVAHV